MTAPTPQDAQTMLSAHRQSALDIKLANIAGTGGHQAPSFNQSNDNLFSTLGRSLTPGAIARDNSFNQADQLFDDLDANRDGVLDRTEFQNMFNGHSEPDDSISKLLRFSDNAPEIIRSIPPIPEVRR